MLANYTQRPGPSPNPAGPASGHHDRETTMKVGIVGLGYVGSAVAYSHRSDDLVLRDPRLGVDSAGMDFIADSDVIYVCVPSPPAADGSCDTACLEQTLSELMRHANARNKPVIAKTTAPPATYRALNLVYANLVHVPEFLTARDHVQSYMSSSYFVLGGNPVWCQTVQDVLCDHVPVSANRCVITDAATAAMYKYMTNAYLATKVTFMNEFYDLAGKIGVGFSDLTAIAQLDDRWGSSHMAVPGPDGHRGWGGACFPKDIAAVVEMAKSLGLAFNLIDSVNQINQHHRSLP